MYFSLFFLAAPHLLCPFAQGAPCLNRQLDLPGFPKCKSELCLYETIAITGKAAFVLGRFDPVAHIVSWSLSSLFAPQHIQLLPGTLISHPLSFKLSPCKLIDELRLLLYVYIEVIDERVRKRLSRQGEKER